MNPTSRSAQGEVREQATAALREDWSKPAQNQTVRIQSIRIQSLKGARLRKHADYQQAYAQARKRQSASMSWFLAPQAAVDAASARVGLTAGKVLGKAHERNRIKRRMREALRRHVELLPAGFDLIFHPRRTVLKVEFAKLEAEVVRILEQARAESARLRAEPAEIQPASPSRREPPQ